MFTSNVKNRYGNGRNLHLLFLSLLLTVGLLIGCQSGDEGPEPTQVEFDPANFVDPTTSSNPYHPLKPGMQWIRGGTTEVGSREVPHQIITTMTDVIRIIDGVPAVAMLDQSTDSGEIAQIGFDYMALDKDGNVWILGGYTEDYEGGQFTNVNSVWLGAKSGGEPGILMPATVTMETPRWYIGTSGPDEDPSVAEPVAIGETVTVAFGTFDNVWAIREGEIGAVDNEIKYYAPGVGVILNEAQDESLHQDNFELINLVELGPEGLAEASQVVLDLEAHAREVAPKIYDESVPAAERMP
ncbi:MAG: hypothetical protein KC445_12585 [Anaerolineales bacterium]|nr:hypothetical protein [Anaerolineales bacterium]